MTLMLHHQTVVYGLVKLLELKAMVNKKKEKRKENCSCNSVFIYYFFFTNELYIIPDLRVSCWYNADSQTKRTIKYIMPVSNPIGK